MDRQFLVVPKDPNEGKVPDALYFHPGAEHRERVTKERKAKKAYEKRLVDIDITVAEYAKRNIRRRRLKMAAWALVLLLAIATSLLYANQGNLGLNSPSSLIPAATSTPSLNGSQAKSNGKTSQSGTKASNSKVVSVTIVAKEHMVLGSKQRISFKSSNGATPVLSAEGACSLDLKTNILTAGGADGFCILRARVNGVERAKSLQVFVNTGELFVRQDLAQRLCESGEVYLKGSGKVEPSPSFIQNNIRYVFFVTSASEVFDPIRSGYKATGYKTESVPDPSQADGWRVVKQYASTPLVTISCIGWPTNYTGDE